MVVSSAAGLLVDPSAPSSISYFLCALAEGTLCSLQCSIMGWGKSLEESGCWSCWAEERPVDVDASALHK